MRQIIMLILFILLLNTFYLTQFVYAKNIPLPKELQAKAFIIYSQRDGWWEKTLVIRFNRERRCLSTYESFKNVLAVVNHSAHPNLWKKVCQVLKTKNKVGGKVYMEEIREKVADLLNIPKEKVAILATAVNMDNLSVVTKRFKTKDVNFVVTALVTAGAKTNALRAGVDKGNYIETEKPHGTVNIILLTNVILTDAAMARAIITITEAKTAAFEDLKVPSSYTPNVQATGTGTDNVIIVSGTTTPKITYTGGHSKIGELIGKAVHEAVVKALEEQNGFKIKK
ncbi:adenosylcobinamide amidohydrolase [Thermodesulfobacterium hydrogeniphilum]|uniref:adenosylcobinamide amidohydrolase n=1 Tax=Thermodesulfobacterium hydrogeniphilum TaxID=161156 RepID=UPI000A95EE6F|nr:adenosylcobinamide amidohydrolase [Thermodesulfobacterium hydrogeniphilum]